MGIGEFGGLDGAAARAFVKRGLLIVFEGLDRSGKTTQCQRVVQTLTEKDGKETKFMRFPDRSTVIGAMIDEYLRGKNELDDHAVHLLFSANRWEKTKEMKNLLDSGVNVIVDRYAFSGVAFSAAKDALSLEWCKQPDRGLPKPDLVCFLDVSAEEAAKRGGFGDERYEKAEFQKKVRENYKRLRDDSYWTVISTDGKSMDEVFEETYALIKNKVIQDRKHNLEPLWPENDPTHNCG